jgi:hypothetical protein
VLVGRIVDQSAVLRGRQTIQAGIEGAIECQDHRARVIRKAARELPVEAAFVYEFMPTRPVDA